MAVEAPQKPLKKTAGKGAPPAIAADAATKHSHTDKPASSERVPFNFSVPAELHKEFRMAAAMHGMSMVAVLKESFELFKQSKGMK